MPVIAATPWCCLAVLARRYGRPAPCCTCSCSAAHWPTCALRALPAPAAAARVRTWPAVGARRATALRCCMPGAPGTGRARSYIRELRVPMARSSTPPMASPAGHRLPDPAHSHSGIAVAGALRAGLQLPPARCTAYTKDPTAPRYAKSGYPLITKQQLRAVGCCRNNCARTASRCVLIAIECRG